MKRSGKEALPRSVLGKALERAAELKAANPDVESYGYGFKYSAEKGYGRAPRPCIKFIVKQKAPELERNTRDQFIPKTLTLHHRGKVWRVLTDVVETASAEQHLLRVRPDNYEAGKGFGGTPSFVAHDGSSLPPLLVTAGHALLSSGNGVVNGQEVLLDPFGPLGKVYGDGTYIARPDGLVDVGAVACKAGAGSLGFYDSAPWACIRASVDDAAIAQMVTNGEAPLCGIIGAATPTLAKFDGRLVTGITFSLDQGPVSYAPGLLLFRAVDGPFAPGDSGAPFVLSNRVLGFHVVGLRADPSLSYSVGAATAIATLSSLTGRTLSVR